jgi:cellulose synthase/poly-beta-1,6-N-acetylglucosamine synthase-like glycosyltransferase
MKVSILIPCHNEEKSIRQCVESCLSQTRPPDQILVVNDGSTDRSGEILAEFGDRIEVISIEKATGNKSYAQERGLSHITGDIFIATDGDTILHPRAVETFVRAYEEQPEAAAVCGYVKSLRHNWITACREMEYVIGQNIFKIAQAYLDAIFVIPGCAGAFRTDIFREHIRFDHDTLTEDLDFTYKLHELGFRIVYARDAVAYTQDPATLTAYINQMRRWYAGGWQNLRKHFGVLKKPNNIFQLSMNYIEGFIFSVAFLVSPLINVRYFEYFILPFLAMILILGGIAAISRKRWDILYCSPAYIVLVYVNAFIFLEQFWIEIVRKQTNLVWYQPERRAIVVRKRA